MRSIRLSKTFLSEAEVLLEQGIARFGPIVIEEKRDQIKNTIDFLTRHPKREKDRYLDIWSYSVTGAPFVLLYDFDDGELRVHLIVHAAADRTLIDLSTVEW